MFKLIVLSAIVACASSIAPIYGGYGAAYGAAAYHAPGYPSYHGAPLAAGALHAPVYGYGSALHAPVAAHYASPYGASIVKTAVAHPVATSYASYHNANIYKPAAYGYGHAPIAAAYHAPIAAGYAGYAAPYAAPYAAYGAYGHGAYSHGAIAAPIVAKAAYPAYGASYATYHH